MTDEYTREQLLDEFFYHMYSGTADIYGVFADDRYAYIFNKILIQYCTSKLQMVGCDFDLWSLFNYTSREEFDATSRELKAKFDEHHMAHVRSNEFSIDFYSDLASMVDSLFFAIRIQVVDKKGKNYELDRVARSTKIIFADFYGSSIEYSGLSFFASEIEFQKELVKSILW